MVKARSVRIRLHHRWRSVPVSIDLSRFERHYLILSLTLVLGGTAGCVLAARMTEQDPSVSVLLLEAGEGNVH